MRSGREFEGDVFLETTAQVARVLGSRRERAEHRAGHQHCQLFSSTYVLGEFKKTFLRDAVRFYGLLLDSEGGADVLHRLDRTFRDRTHRRSVKLFAVLLEDPEIDRDSLLTRLQNLIEWQLESRFLSGLAEELIDETGCARATARATRVNAAYEALAVRCAKDRPPICGIGRFWHRNRTSLSTVEEKLLGSSTDRELQRMCKEARGLLVMGGAPQGRTCEALGDAIIALECPREAGLETTNERHFRPLCDILGKKLLVWK